MVVLVEDAFGIVRFDVAQAIAPSVAAVHEPLHEIARISAKCYVNRAGDIEQFTKGIVLFWLVVIAVFFLYLA